MLDIYSLTSSDKGSSVVYTPFEGCDEGLLEYGHITSWNDKFIFVDYGDSCGRGKATSPQDLRFA